MNLFDEKPTPHIGGYYDRDDWAYEQAEMDDWIKRLVELYTEELIFQQDRFIKTNERLQVLKGWADAHYIKSGRSRGVQMLFDLVEGREDHRVCANCGVYTDNFCIIEKGAPGENWIEDVWVKMGMLGKPICGECYYQ